MAKITLKGNDCNTSGELPAVGSAAPDFTLVAGDLSEKSLADYAGKNVVLNIVPSLDTGTCAMSAKTFNGKAGEAGDTVIVNVSMDLPFAQKRFCEAESLEHIDNLSAFRCSGFGDSYGAAIVDGPLKGLLCRAVVIIDGEGKVKYTQLVPEIVDEPDYGAALGAL
ncbi:thiol peroxidase [Mariniblastus fucicola]|uniref:Thiol peroxidase n=1 Tax=Mariniblastus fucicola TaxID=980251 RepID=A0A5B9P7C6_9BACT|nr:thiol peroxidase [Mariniblastus fucicola]QEG21399.1 putative thiol peroxidase [Mariniblastus fucicola]